MGEVVQLDEQRPHVTYQLTCDKCQHVSVVVFEEQQFYKTTVMDCGGCGATHHVHAVWECPCGCSCLNLDVQKNLFCSACGEPVPEELYV